ncbi:Conserved oligomeric Golgi complex subunit, partial [Quaeritorhiza haematococci]
MPAVTSPTTTNATGIPTAAATATSPTTQNARGQGRGQTHALESVDELLRNPEFKDFTADDFDPTDYANLVIRGGPEQQEQQAAFHGLDISTALAKLTFSIDHLNKQMYQQVATNYEDLLKQVTSVHQLDPVLEKVKQNVQSLNSSLDRIRAKIKTPYERIQQRTLQLERIQSASDVLRRVIRFLQLSRRLEAQIQDGERGLAKAALCINEIESILKESDLSGIAVVDSELPIIQRSKAQIVSEAEGVLERGLVSQTQSDIAAALQVFYNLGSMAQKVQAVVDRILADSVGKAVQHAFNVQSINREVKESAPAASSGPVRRVNEPTLASSGMGSGGAGGMGAGGINAWANVLWSRMEDLMDVLYVCCVKIYLLERVLARKRDPVTHVVFLDEVVKNMDGSIVTYFWRILSNTFERELRLSTKGSQLLQQIFQNGYPRLLRLFHDFFSRVALVSGNTHTAAPSSTLLSTPTAIHPSQQNSSINNTTTTSSTSPTNTPEATLLLRTLSSFETAYLARSLSRLLDPINMAFPERGAGAMGGGVGGSGVGAGPRTGPSRDDVERIVRVISSELEMSKFDRPLLRSVSRNISKTLLTYALKCESRVSTDPSVAYQVSGVATATAAQCINVDIVN